MTCRLISFVPPPPSAAVISKVHEAVWADDQFKLKGSTIRSEAERMVLPLQSLVYEAEKLELEAVACNYRPPSKIQIDADLIRRRLNGIYRGLPERAPDDPAWLDRDLQNAVSMIQRRRTVFLVPDYWPAKLPLPKSHSPQESKECPVEKFLQSVAAELQGRLSIYTSTSNIGFLRLRRQATVGERVRKPDELADHEGLMRSFMKRLLALSNKDMGIGIFAEGGFATGADVPEGPILFEGPTGSGKSLAAGLLALSLRKNVVPVNVAGLTESILEGQMRGHVKGHFTGATQNEDGWFAKADGQVLFLDEFQNASLASQIQLLDLLDPFSDDVYVNRIGESRRTRYTVKVVIAVNQTVQKLLTTGALREDLYYRIRKVVRFRSLDEVLKAMTTPGDKARIVRRLALLYRWKSSPFWQDPSPANGLLSQPGFPSLFPEIEDKAINLIADATWTGSFRELERVIADIYWKNDCRGSSAIEIDEVKAELAKAARWPGDGGRPVLPTANGSSAQEISDLVVRLCSRETDVQAGDARSWDRVYLEVVQDLLVMNRFNIEGTVAALKPTRINLGSRQSLRAFLRENLERLRPEIRAHEKIDRFLGGYRAL